MSYLCVNEDEWAGVVKVERFYSRTDRAWVLYFATAAGHQVGAAEYIGNGKAAADVVEGQMRDILTTEKARTAALYQDETPLGVEMEGGE